MKLFISGRASTIRVLKLQPHEAEAEALIVREALSKVKQDHRSNTPISLWKLLELWLTIGMVAILLKR